MCLRKNDPTGSYWYDADGVSPASDVLSDGYSAFTPGISETHGAGGGAYASVFYLADAQGNSRGLLDGGQGNPDGYNWDAFGNLVSRGGTNPTAYAWNEESGYQSDNDSGLKLLGHRYYDSRTGRFLSQDPAGDGDNWYGYADNDPMNETDPSGLPSFFDPSKAGTAPGGGPSAWGDYNSGSPGTYDFFSGNTYTHSETISAALNAAFTSTSGPMMGAGPAGMGGGMFAGKSGPQRDPIDPERGHGDQGNGKMGDDHTNPRAGDKGNQNHGARGYPKNPVGKREAARLAEKQAQKVANNLAKAERAAAAGEEGTAEIAEGLELGGPVGMVIGAGIAMWDLYHHPLNGITTLTWRTDRP